MEAKHKEILRKNKISLVNDMPIDVLNELVQRQIFKSSEQEIYLSKLTTDRNTKILIDITRKGPKAFRALAESLFAAGSNHLATLLIPDLNEYKLHDLTFYEFNNNENQPPVLEQRAGDMQGTAEGSKKKRKRKDLANDTATDIPQDRYIKMISIYVLTSPVNHGKYWEFHAFNDKLEYLRGKIKAENVSIVEKIKEGSFRKVAKAKQSFNENIWELEISDNTAVVFQGGNNDFEIPREKLKTFFTPDEVSIDEAMGSPKRRRVTIQGDVTLIEKKVVRETWQRRDIHIKNTSFEIIKLKLWAEKADEVTEEHDGETFCFTNVEVDSFKNKNELKTIRLTRIENLSKPRDRNIQVMKQIIDGIDPTVEPMVLVTKECKQLICDHEVFKTLSLGIDAFRSLFPVECNITADQQNKVTTISIVRK